MYAACGCLRSSFCGVPLSILVLCAELGQGYLCEATFFRVVVVVICVVVAGVMTRALEQQRGLSSWADALSMFWELDPFAGFGPSSSARCLGCSSAILNVRKPDVLLALMFMTSSFRNRRDIQASEA